MEEAEWLKEQRHAQGMLWTLRKVAKITRTNAGKRKCRLFACGCCRLVWNLLSDSRLRDAVEVAEWFAEGQTGAEELEVARLSVRGMAHGAFTPDAPGVRERTAASMAASTTSPKAFSAAFDVTALPVPLAGLSIGKRNGHAILCDLVRCVFGNPYRPLRLEPTWLKWNDGLLGKLAQAVYEHRVLPQSPLDPVRLGVLADALEEAGCQETDLLQHLRGPGPHVRGCHVVDSILAKE